MMLKLASVALVLGLAMNAGILWAHHSFAAEFDGKKPLVLRGIVTEWELTNPHWWIHLDVKDANRNTAS
jgi:hypothetical protein